MRKHDFSVFLVFVCSCASKMALETWKEIDDECRKFY